MVIEFRLPEVGEHIESATVVEVLVAPGQRVEKEQVVAVLETEKATLDVPSSVAGTVREVRIKKGETIQVGVVLLTVEEGEGGETSASAPKEKREEKRKKQPSTESTESTPSTASTETEKRLHTEPDIPSGEEVEEEIKPAAARGGKISEGAEATLQPPASSLQPSEVLPGVAASPAVRRLAREIGVDIDEVKGSGPGGRLSEEDVKRYARERPGTGKGQGPSAGNEERAGTPALPGDERQALPTIRRLTGQHMARAWATIPHVHQRDRADITELERLRREHNEALPPGAPKLTMTAILAKLMAGLLSRNPRFNASIDANTNELILKKSINIGIAVDTERGLLVPVIRDANLKSVRMLTAELDELAKKARASKLAPGEMQGGTFTISNLGGIGGTSFDPIVNAPEVAILGVAHAAEEVVPIGGQPAIRLMLPLTLGYDHRVIDGAEGARFLREAAAALSHPFELLIEV